jgi:hypothetical protein
LQAGGIKLVAGAQVQLQHVVGVVEHAQQLRLVFGRLEYGEATAHQQQQMSVARALRQWHVGS